MRQFRWSKNFVRFATRCFPSMGTAKLAANTATSTGRSRVTKPRHRPPVYNEQERQERSEYSAPAAGMSIQNFGSPRLWSGRWSLPLPFAPDHSFLNPKSIRNSQGVFWCTRCKAFFFPIVHKILSHGFLSQTKLWESNFRSNVLERYFYWRSAG